MAKVKKLVPSSPDQEEQPETVIPEVVTEEKATAKRSSRREATKKIIESSLTAQDEPIVEYIDDAEAAIIPVEGEFPTIPSLASRLGSVKELPDGQVSGCISSFMEQLSTFGLGDLDGRLEALSLRITEEIKTQDSHYASLGKSTRSLETLEPVLLSTFEASSSKIPPMLVYNLLCRMEKDTSFVPKRMITLLLERGLISDASHPLLIDRLVAYGDMDLLFTYLHKARSLGEVSIAKVLKAFLVYSKEKITPKIKKNFKQFTALETCILSLFELAISTDSIKKHLKSISMGDFLLLMGLLERLFHIYSQSHAELLLLGTDKKVEAQRLLRLPSRLNVIKWTEVLIDSHYPAVLSNDEALQRMQSILSLVSVEQTVSLQCLETRCIITSLAAMAAQKRLEEKKRIKGVGKKGDILAKKTKPDTPIATKYLIEAIDI